MAYRLRYVRTLILLFGIVLVGSWGCAPQARGGDAVQSVQFFFSAEAWGELPFTISERQQALVQATLRRDVARLERAVSFGADDPVRVREAVAIYEVDKRQGLPTLISGYRLELQVPESLLGNQITLVNRSTNIARVVTLVSNVSLGTVSP